MQDGSTASFANVATQIKCQQPGSSSRDLVSLHPVQFYDRPDLHFWGINFGHDLKKLEWDRSSFADIDIINKPVQLTAATFQLTHQHSSCCWVFSLQSIKTCKKHTTVWGSYPKNDVKTQPTIFLAQFTQLPPSPLQRDLPVDPPRLSLWKHALDAFGVHALHWTTRKKDGEQTENRSQPFWKLWK